MAKEPKLARGEVIRVQYAADNGRVDRMEITRETEHSLWLRKPLRGKPGRYYEVRVANNPGLVHDTWAEARTQAIEQAQDEVDDARGWLREKERELAKAEALPETEPKR